MKPLPAPPGWKQTIDDLMAEMKAGARPSISGDEAAWARAYERSLLPADTRFPRQGDTYEVNADLESVFLTSWQSPFTGSGRGLLRKGDRFVINEEPASAEATSVSADALDYPALEERLVTEADRRHPQYSGFYLSFKTAELNRSFRLVDPA